MLVGHLQKVDKACFQHDIGSGDFKYLTSRTTSDKIVRDKAFNISENRNMMDINEVLLQLFINVLKKKLLVLVLKMRICQTSN